jgi:hypothetical protein
MFSFVLTLDALQAPIFSLEQFGDPDLPLRSGAHFSGRYRGRYSIRSSIYEQELPIPSRDKHLTLYSNQEESLPRYAELFGSLDSSYPGDTWLQKLAKVRTYSSPDNYLVVNTEGTHGHFSILANDCPLELIGVHDPQLKTTHLLLADGADAANYVRSVYPLRFFLYRFPPIVNRVVFLQTQTVSSHWWRYIKGGDLLFAFNALEMKLFREV